MTYALYDFSGLNCEIKQGNGISNQPDMWHNTEATIGD